tara:strand:- start:59 stop:745 length:687 start_codon:yes stop_codon:yes gene_type:complete
LTSITYSIIFILLIVSILLGILFLRLYRKIKSSDKDSINLINFPLELEKKINDFVTESKENNKDLIKSHLNAQETTKKIIQDLDEKIAPFEKVAREKNDELKIYKEGYDYSKNKSIINGIIDTIEFMETAEKKIDPNNEIIKSYFVTTKDKLLIILDNASIEKFSPKLLSSAINNIGCEVDNSTEKTNQRDKNDLIQSVLKPGYKLILNNKEEKILKKALVKVFEFEN